MVRASFTMSCAGSLLTLGLAWLFVDTPSTTAGESDSSAARGKVLFLKQWAPLSGGPREPDGLGPVYNERSCVGCHNQAGSGGGGPREKDVEMITYKGSDPKEARWVHPAMIDSPTVVLHRHGTSPGYAVWLSDLPMTLFNDAKRNTPALFGAGILDAIPRAVIEQAEKQTNAKFPEIKGRIVYQFDGKIGRFGWKAQVSTLEDFVHRACANELGLEVPGVHQPVDPTASRYANLNPDARQLDLNAEECRDLTNYIASLPAPRSKRPATAVNAKKYERGRSLFESVGCAACHRPNLGAAEGVYSELLVHDMGPSLSSGAVYYGSALGRVAIGKRNAAPATDSEWRTPPLWGVADSAPYLHDSRAATLEAAIQAHDGEASRTVARYRGLSGTERNTLIAFLRTLKAPAEPVGLAKLRALRDPD